MAQAQASASSLTAAESATFSGNTVINNVLTNNGLPGVAFHSHVGPNFGAPADDLNGNFIINNRISGNGADAGDTPRLVPPELTSTAALAATPITGNVIWGNSIR